VAPRTRLRARDGDLRHERHRASPGPGSASELSLLKPAWRREQAAYQPPAAPSPMLFHADVDRSRGKRLVLSQVGRLSLYESTALAVSPTPRLCQVGIKLLRPTRSALRGALAVGFMHIHFYLLRYTATSSDQSEFSRQQCARGTGASALWLFARGQLTGHKG
jgi:hypothetical protein